jgi:hypothetical protein
MGRGYSLSEKIKFSCLEEKHLEGIDMKNLEEKDAVFIVRKYEEFFGSLDEHMGYSLHERISVIYNSSLCVRGIPYIHDPVGFRKMALDFSLTFPSNLSREEYEKRQMNNPIEGLVQIWAYVNDEK